MCLDVMGGEGLGTMSWGVESEDGRMDTETIALRQRGEAS